MLPESGQADVLVTPEMAEAGARILMDIYDALRPEAETRAKDIFREMYALLPSPDARGL